MNAEIYDEYYFAIRRNKVKFLIEGDINNINIFLDGFSMKEYLDSSEIFLKDDDLIIFKNHNVDSEVATEIFFRCNVVRDQYDLISDKDWGACGHMPEQEVEYGQLMDKRLPWCKTA